MNGRVMCLDEPVRAEASSTVFPFEDILLYSTTKKRGLRLISGAEALKPSGTYET
jgi:hypothetical protein